MEVLKESLRWINARYNFSPEQKEWHFKNSPSLEIIKFLVLELNYPVSEDILSYYKMRKQYIENTLKRKFQ